ncbi:MAG: VWA domain-containing protein [Flavobacteriaceae bacterium]|nr:MAG: VWA domain-containing protein [Flavobacteriaceae bacterium]
MTFQNVLWIGLCAVLAFGGVWYLYFFRAKNYPSKYLLACLRFISFMGILLLLIPLNLEKITPFTEKQGLILLLDNSGSAGRDPAREQILRARDLFSGDRALRDRFDLSTYVFGKSLRNSDSLDFSENGTDITSALESLSRGYLDENTSIVLITDGIENQGRSLGAAAKSYAPVYPVVVGDTTRYEDIRIDQVNLNRYAFLDNQFPVEVLISYSGSRVENLSLSILDNGKRVFQQDLQIKAGRSTLRVNVLLKADKVGFHQITASVPALENERNIRNNSQVAGIEVIDETTQITIVSSHPHPDLGMLKRSIEVNEQRQARVVKPSEAASLSADTDLWILFQPDLSFRPVYNLLENSKTPLVTITGGLTDWNFLNSVQGSFTLEEAGPEEELLAELNPSFGYFDVSQWEVSGYPPLEGDLGEYQIFPQNEWLLGQRVKGVSLNEPLFALIGGETRREAVIFGSGLWKWRMNAFSSSGTFQDFDSILGKLWLFLTAGQHTERLSLEYRTLYSGQQPTVIRARFFDQALRFDPQARLNLQLYDSTGTEQASYPIPLGKGYYEADISNLDPGFYSFEVVAEGTDFRKSGQFRLLAFELENQQLSSNIQGLSRLAEDSGGALYFPSDISRLRDSLLGQDRFRPVRRSRRNVVSLIDYHWLLILIASSLGAEWFIRKYNGLL